ncbi:MAG: hypothetical protein JRH18_16565 [Deltaproteobacteria bacterium]|nr:hypothetical protein [Deltaproteobacteria bacterium]MBW1959842.1 hypothetical protein [Deltaproteobacteria bacterium]MBW1993502.1 hypothetical protein [Deltaproteobacteria bacterium]MBW2153272.1 hypothetical protein [Deltaproteobacteria bacterium]
MKFLEGKIHFTSFDDGTISVNKAIKPEGSRARLFSMPSPVPMLDVSDGLPPKRFDMIILPSKILFDPSVLFREPPTLQKAIIWRIEILFIFFKNYRRPWSLTLFSAYIMGN